MNKRHYTNTLREEVAANKRSNTIKAAAQFFREDASQTAFSLDLVAKAAGVTRLTVYNQFGSRAGLLEAVFDDLASSGGIFRLAEIESTTPPAEMMNRLVEIFCDFWGSDAALGRLHDAMSTDQEISSALNERMNRGHQVIAQVVEKLIGKAPGNAKREAVDLIFALTSLSTYRMLIASRPAAAVRQLIQVTCHDILIRAAKR